VSAAHALAPDARARVEEAQRHGREVTGVTHDSRAVAAGTIFVAVRGQRADGAAFAGDAQRRGAVAIVAENAAPAGIDIPWIRTPTHDSRWLRLPASFTAIPANR
jgi:UDP-N-acetylmuramyl tripeptide synthase